MTSTLFYTDHHRLPLPAGHRFPIEKYGLLREILKTDGKFRLEPAPLADAQTLRIVHDAGYVEAFLKGVLSDSAMRRIGFPWSEGLVTRTLASVGSTIAATREALETGWGGTLAGGTHHAFASEGSGFCVFNDIAIAARWVMQAENANGCSPSRVAILDLDVHQGDGTAAILQDDSSMLTVSMHCKANFPLRKRRSSIDIELDAGVGDAEYLRALESLLPRLCEFRPEFVFYQSGVDGLASDRLGRLRLSHAGLIDRDRMVMRTVRDMGVPFVITLGGGYSHPISLTAEAHANTFRVAAEILGQHTSAAVEGFGSSEGRLLES
jgi:acetoin utilization deacetylase AcuC-like enzyme